MIEMRRCARVNTHFVFKSRILQFHIVQQCLQAVQFFASATLSYSISLVFPLYLFNI